MELQPGSPSASTLSAGATIPITQTADPVQLDQVLDALNTDTRGNLQNFLIGYGDGLTRKPDHEEDAEQEPEVRGIDGAQALNKAYERGPSALRGNAIVNQALGGTEEHDLSKLIASIDKVTSALDVHEQVLSEWIPNFNAFFNDFASQAAEPHRDRREAAERAQERLERTRLAERRISRGRELLESARARRQGNAGDDRSGAAVDRTGQGLAGPG